MTVKISNFDGSNGIVNNNYTDQYGNTWAVLRLIEESKKYKTFKMPLIGIDLSRMPWNNMANINDFAAHMNHVNKVKLKYPILLDSDGIICDGWHRIVKAIIKGKKYIKAIRLEDMPNRDSFEENN